MTPNQFLDHLMYLLLQKQNVEESDVKKLEKRKYKLEKELQDIEYILQRVLVDCPGEAHTNAFIDNCWTCAPRWGKILGPNVNRKKRKGS